MWCWSWHTTIEIKPHLLIQQGNIMRLSTIWSDWLYLSLYYLFCNSLISIFFIFNSSKHLIELSSGRPIYGVFALILYRKALLFKRRNRCERECKSEYLWLNMWVWRNGEYLAQVNSVFLFSLLKLKCQRNWNF